MHFILLNLQLVAFWRAGPTRLRRVRTSVAVLEPHRTRIQGDAMHSIIALSTMPRRPGRPAKGKTRITIYLDDEVLREFRAHAERTGTGYQTLINAALRTRLAAA